jgi:SAM-dependent methyltransferase
MSQGADSRSDLLRHKVEAHLVCPECRKPFEFRGDELRCQGCGFEAAVRDGVMVMGKVPPTSFFDDKFQVMQEGHREGRGDWEFAYRQQVAFLEPYLKSASTVLDVGCGPSISYEKPAGAFLAGLEYSFPSIRSNRDLDLAICGSATAVPLADGAVDLAICFYSLHHMVGNSVAESRGILEMALSELSRVLRKGGHLVVFEMRPKWHYRLIQGLGWNLARSVLGGRLDMHMWPQAVVETAAGLKKPEARFEARLFEASQFLMFPPVFALPWLKIPRLLYPLSPVAYVWSKP